MKNKIWLATLEGTFKEIEIQEWEITRALWNYTKGYDGIYEGGAGKIRAITPDHVQSMGWNKGHKPTPEDWNDIKNKLGKNLENMISNIKLLMLDSKTLEELENKVDKILLEDSTMKGQKQISGSFKAIGDY